MKRLNLLIMMFAMVLVNTACDKNDDEEPTPTFKHIIELNELMGYWQHQSTEYMGDVITNCDELSASFNIPENKKGLIIFELDIKPKQPGEITYVDGYCDWHVGCSSYINDGLDFILFDTENKIEIGDGAIFEILSYNKTTRELKIKFLKPDEYYVPVGAIITFKKQ
ncbi:MAG: hypothetical protein WHS63_12610 [Tenuifilum sp.]|uniref:hypothetical protein n=1 Tax=Tenuifilum sp. TaxID=2760880 RepID=UPI0030981F57